MDLALKDKVVIITGGGSNIGRAISLSFGKEGANTVIAELDEPQGQKIVEEIKGQGGKAKVIKTDVTSYDSVQAMVKTVLDEFGKVDILVNDVGWDNFTPFMKTKENWDKWIDLNFRSVLNGIHCVLPSMMEKKYGRIVNIGSDAGRIGEFHETVYAGCKAGVIGLSKAVAREAGRYGITVNVICPGATLATEDEVGSHSLFTRGSDTWSKLEGIFSPEREEMLIKRSYPLGRLGKAQDIANAVLFFASDSAEFITGQTLSVSGGYTMM